MAAAKKKKTSTKKSAKKKVAAKKTVKKKKVVSKKTAKKTVASVVPEPAYTPVGINAESDAAPYATPSSSYPQERKKKKGITITKVLIAVAFFAFVRYVTMPNGQTITQMAKKVVKPMLSEPAPQVPGKEGAIALPVPWKHGTEIQLEVVDKFADQSIVFGLAADKDGRVYILTAGMISLYKDGVKTSSLMLDEAGAAATMAFDGKYLYVAGMYGDKVTIIPADLSSQRVIGVPGALSITGITVGKAGEVFVYCKGNKKIYATNSESDPLMTLGGGDSAHGHLGWVSDMGFDSQGRLFTHDHEMKRITRFDSKGVLDLAYAVPWGQANRERMAVVSDVVYICGFNDRKLYMMDSNGMTDVFAQKIDGIDISNLHMVGKGFDGFVYIRADNHVYKVKPVKF